MKAFKRWFYRQSQEDDFFLRVVFLWPTLVLLTVSIFCFDLPVFFPPESTVKDTGQIKKDELEKIQLDNRLLEEKIRNAKLKTEEVQAGVKKE